MDRDFKKCAGCGEVKPIGEFWSNIVRGRDYRHYKCKACASAVNKERRSRIKLKPKTLPLSGEKTCRVCHQTFGIENFYPCSVLKDGLASQCKGCAKEAAKLSAARYPDRVRATKERYKARKLAEDPNWKALEWAQIPVERRKKYSRRAKYRQYGITVEVFNEMVRNQSGRCAICGHLPPKDAGHNKSILHVDHCHETGKVRGLLCHACNVSLGLMKDNPEALINAATYIRSFQKEGR